MARTGYLTVCALQHLRRGVYPRLRAAVGIPSSADLRPTPRSRIRRGAFRAMICTITVYESKQWVGN
jgi:hypothetical protein